MKKCARRSENLNSDPGSGWGKTFLFTKTLSVRLFSCSNLAPEDEIVEIGPGLGFLTRRLVNTAKKSLGRRNRFGLGRSFETEFVRLPPGFSTDSQ